MEETGLSCVQKLANILAEKWGESCGENDKNIFSAAGDFISLDALNLAAEIGIHMVMFSPQAETVCQELLAAFQVCLQCCCSQLDGVTPCLPHHIL